MMVGETRSEDQRLIRCTASPSFIDWVARSGGSLLVSTYQAGKVVALGFDGKQLTVLPRDYDKPLGVASDGQRLAIAGRHEIIILADAPPLARDFLETQPGKYDSVYLPRVSYHTGDLHTHDLGFGRDGLCFVNTRFSCLAVPSDVYNFVPMWTPTFISDVCPEDRCHLNGLAMQNGQPKYVTALGESDVVGGWREKKAVGGIVIDVESNEIVGRDLSMPHSPRIANGRLFLLDSGRGELITLDPLTGRRTTVCRLKGYLRGLSIVDRFAAVGLCKIRESSLFGGLPIQERGDPLSCGVAIVDIERGLEVGFFEFTSGVEEIFEVHFLPRRRRPMITHPAMPETRDACSTPLLSYWFRESNIVGEAPSA